MSENCLFIHETALQYILHHNPHPAYYRIRCRYRYPIVLHTSCGGVPSSLIPPLQARVVLSVRYFPLDSHTTWLTIPQYVLSNTCYTRPSFMTSSSPNLNPQLNRSRNGRCLATMPGAF